MVLCETLACNIRRLNSRSAEDPWPVSLNVFDGMPQHCISSGVLLAYFSASTFTALPVASCSKAISCK